MAQNIIFPKLGQTMEEGAIVAWLKKEGDKIAKGDILFEIETDKANLEVESFWEGTLLKITVPEGVTVPVNTIVGYIGEVGEKIPQATETPISQPAQPKTPQAPALPKAAVAAADAASVKQNLPTRPKDSPTPPQPAVPKTVPISPRARALIRDKAVSTAGIIGSGHGGRVVERDVRQYLDAHDYAKILISPAALQLARQNKIDILSVRGSGESGRIMVADIERAIKQKPVTLSRMRQVIAQRLTESKQTIPHFYVTVTADMTELLKFRAELKAAGTTLSVNDFILQAVVLACEEFPVVNSRTDGRTISWRGDVDLGMAVSVENGLVVPVIRSAQILSLKELSEAARTLARKARDGKLTPDEMSGSGITVSNMGMMNVENFHAIVNPGEAAILAVSSARETPVVCDGEIRIRSIMKMTLSADHRIVDGSTAAAFCNAIAQKLQDITFWHGTI